MKFLIVKPSSLGDILHAFPAVSLLASSFPEARIDWLVHPAFAELLQYHPSVRRPILFKRKELGSFKTFFPEVISLFEDIRSERYDAVFDLQGLLRSAIISRLSNANMVFGPENPKEPLSKLFYSKTLPVASSSMHAMDRNSVMISSFLGLDTPSEATLSLPPIKSKKDSLLKHLNSMDIDTAVPLVGIAPGARWDTKRWPPDFFANLILSLSAKLPDSLFIITGSVADSSIARKVSSITGSLRTFDLTGRTSIAEMVELARACSLFISNDSGPMHIAAAVGTPVLALFGPTDPNLTGPRSLSSEVLQPNLDCIKCLKRYCQKALCHSSIDPDSAAKAAIDLMKRSRPQ